MLMLSRRKGEDVLIVVGGRRVLVRVVTTGKTTTLGFEAPDDVTIVRPEVLHIAKKEAPNGLERPALGGPICSVE
jgi:sRNA-binding carbon storage regulator CsrA